MPHRPKKKRPLAPAPTGSDVRLISIIPPLPATLSDVPLGGTARVTHESKLRSLQADQPAAQVRAGLAGMDRKAMRRAALLVAFDGRAILSAANVTMIRAAGGNNVLVVGNPPHPRRVSHQLHKKAVEHNALQMGVHERVAFLENAVKRYARESTYPLDIAQGIR